MGQLVIDVPATKFSVPEGETDFKAWEQFFFEEGKKLAKQALLTALDQRDLDLAANRDSTRYVLKGLRSRTLLTVLGEVNLSRRYYWDTQENRYCALLDETLGIEKESRLSGRLKDLSVWLATETSYENVSSILATMLGETVSRQSIWHSVQQRGGAIQAEEQRQRDGLFEEGKTLANPPKAVECLFGEADGCFISLQRTAVKKTELKVGVWYEGWKKKDVKRVEYELVNKHYVGSAGSAETFWEQMSVEAEKRYGASQTPTIYVGGDGAAWIEAGAKWLGADRLKLDRFHLHRMLGRAFGFSDSIAAVVEHLNQGKENEALKRLAAQSGDEADDKKREKMAKAMAWIHEHAKDLTQVVYPDDARPWLKRQLGTMERHVDLAVANRFKKRGMSWSLKGAGNLLALRLHRLNYDGPPSLEPIELTEAPVMLSERTGKLPAALHVHEAHVPVLETGKSWAKGFRRMVSGSGCWN